MICSILRIGPLFYNNNVSLHQLGRNSLLLDSCMAHFENEINRKINHMNFLYMIDFFKETHLQDYNTPTYDSGKGQATK